MLKKNFISQKIFENVHISYCRGRAIFTTRILEMMTCSAFMHSDVQLIDLYFCNLRHPLQDPLFVQGRSKRPPIMAILWQLITWEMTYHAALKVNVAWPPGSLLCKRYEGPLSLLQNFLGGLSFCIFDKNYTDFLKKSNSLNPYATTCVGQGCHSTCISPKYI